VKRKSAAADELDNNPSKRKRDRRRAAPSAPAKPKGLGARAAEEWKRITRQLEGEGRLSQVDLTLIADHCMVVERIEQAEVAIDKLGLLVPGERGMVKNPAVQMSRDYRDRFHRGLQLLGLDPGRRDAAPPSAVQEDPEGLLD
jgi:P27 family predicted phage terminase small subunit